MMSKRLFAFLLLLSAWPLAARAQSSEELFVRGNDLYRAGKYPEASASYELILTRQEASAPVFFNLGNAYYRLGKTGPAILAYERAARLAPADADIRHNLRLLNLRTLDRIEPIPDLFLVQWMRAAATLCSPAAASAAFITLWALFFFSLAAMYLLPSGRALIAARVVVLISLAGILVSVGFIALQRINDDSRDQAIVLAGTVTAKSSPDQASVDAFVIHEGLKVRMSDALGTWVKVTLPDGKVGWIPSSACERI